MAKRLQNFTEATYQDGKPTIDRDAGVIRGVKILGATSKNGRDYSPQAMKEAAALYEGIGVNSNHPNRSSPNVSRTIEEGIGWLENVTQKPDGVYGDLHVIKHHALAESIFEVAERKPDRFGLSHNAAGECVQRGQRSCVESVKSVRSVDLVQNPATNSSLFESEEPVAEVRLLKDILESMKPGPSKAKLIRFVDRCMVEMDGMPMDPSMPVPAMATDGDGTDSEGSGDPFDDVIQAGIAAICADASLDWPARKEKIDKLIDLATTMADAPAGDTPPEGDKAVAESTLEKRLAAAEAELQEARDEKACRALLTEAKLDVTDKRVNLLKGVKAATRKDLIEEWTAAPKVPLRPARSAPVPLVESVGSDGHKPAKGADAMISAYR